MALQYVQDWHWLIDERAVFLIGHGEICYRVYLLHWLLHIAMGGFTFNYSMICLDMLSLLMR